MFKLTLDFIELRITFIVAVKQYCSKVLKTVYLIHKKCNIRMFDFEFS